MSNSAGKDRDRGPRYGYPQVSGSERLSRSAARTASRGRGRKRKETCGPMAWHTRPCFTAVETFVGVLMRRREFIPVLGTVANGREHA